MAVGDARIPIRHVNSQCGDVVLSPAGKHALVIHNYEPVLELGRYGSRPAR